MAVTLSCTSASCGTTISTLLLGSSTMALVSRSRHCPSASPTLNPSGKRGVISVSTNAVQSLSLTPSASPILRPNMRSISSIGLSGAWHSIVCADAGDPNIAIAKKRLNRNLMWSIETGPTATWRCPRSSSLRRRAPSWCCRDRTTDCRCRHSLKPATAY